MPDFYQVMKIEGKGFGCVATQDITIGTLILSENPQIAVIDNDGEGFLAPTYVREVMKSFHLLEKADQEEYLKLSAAGSMWLNRQNKDTLCHDIAASIGLEFNLSGEKTLDILFIYNSNLFEFGFGIQSSRFNHSCSSNALASKNEELQAIEIRAVSKIKKGTEITIDYNPDIAMKSKTKRQEFLLANMGFSCCCQLCTVGKMTTF